MIECKLSYEIINYTSPVPVRGRIISQNEFLKVTVLEKDYFVSVLPGFHESSLREIAYKIEHFFKNYALNFSHIDFDKRFFNLVSDDEFLITIKTDRKSVV